ncbi:hypothetical protein RJ640_013597 [Escallonia rubra]|uniref:Uncharacterized protein n=1 Tax=Escallonia rubra TaxID=112253 RepID=A0AA88URL2_9ASTE|nr:hypothetical protein RJ640_013597 [Escallonia rubra]
MASLPFLSSLTFNSANASGSSASPSGSKEPPGPSPSGPRSTNPVPFNQAHEDDLGGPDGKDALGMNKVRVAKIVKATFREDLGPGLEPNCLPEFDAILCKEFGKDTAQCTKHSPSAVDHLKLTVLGKCLRIS